jgi:hypothetical protein
MHVKQLLVSTLTRGMGYKISCDWRVLREVSDEVSLLPQVPLEFIPLASLKWCLVILFQPREPKVPEMLSLDEEDHSNYIVIHFSLTLWTLIDLMVLLFEIDFESLKL